MHLLGSNNARLSSLKYRLTRRFMNPIEQFPIEDVDQRPCAGFGAMVALQASRKRVLVEFGGSAVGDEARREFAHAGADPAGPDSCLGRTWWFKLSSSGDETPFD